jgi:hypothetical protein
MKEAWAGCLVIAPDKIDNLFALLPKASYFCGSRF